MWERAMMLGGIWGEVESGGWLAIREYVPAKPSVTKAGWMDIKFYVRDELVEFRDSLVQAAG